MRKKLTATRVAWLAGCVTALLLAACSPKNTATNDLLYVPTARQISTRLVNATVGRIPIPERGEVKEWLLPTATPLAAGIFDKVFGKLIPPQVEAAAAPVGRMWGTVTALLLNVREGPGSDYTILTALDAGERLPVVEQSEGWVRFTLPDGRSGWSAAEYVTLEVEEIKTPQPPAAAKAIVLVELLNVRDQPDVNGAVVAALGKQECVPMLGQQDGWVQVGLPSAKSGWCHGDFVQGAAVCPTPAPPDPYAVGGAVSAPAPVQNVAYSAPAAPSATPTQPGPPPVAPNGSVVMSTSLHECFGGGWDEVRSVRAGTPVQVIGSGPFAPPGSQANELGPGPYVKIRLWDGQSAWIAAQALGISNPAGLTQISGQCEPGDRIDWSVIPTHTPAPVIAPVQAAAASTPRPQPTARLQGTSTPVATVALTPQKRDE